MAAVPKNKHSKMVKRKRRTHYKLHAPTLNECQNCGGTKRAHHVCPSCGYYGKKIRVLDIGG